MSVVNHILETIHSHLTVWVLGFVVAVIALERLVGARKRGVKVLVGLFVAHVAAVLVAAFGVGALDIQSEASLLARLLGGWVFVLGVGTLIFEVALPKARVSLSRIIEDLVVFGGVALISIFILRRGGVDVTGIVATSAVVTAVIGLSLQDTLGNTIGGLTLQLDDSIHTGDWIKVGDVVGRVKDVRWRFTAVETRNWETVFIPNSKLVKENVTVLGKRAGQPEQWRRWVYFNVDFRQQPTTVIDVVLAALQSAPIASVADEPAPNCVLMSLGDSTAAYAVRYWLTDIAVDDPTDSAVRTRIFFALQRANIPLAMPAQAVFVTEDTQKRRDRKQSEANRLRVETLARVDVFRPLLDDEREQVAGLLESAPFSRGECITRQGAEAHWLYLIVKGEVSVRVALDGAEKEVATLHAGEVFGEMSLLTGENRTASVYALSDVECWRLTRDDFHQILAQRPEVAGPIAALLAERRVHLMAVRENLDVESRGKRLQEEEAHLLKKMRAFFGI